jgi:hypothetical protein
MPRVQDDRDWPKLPFPLDGGRLLRWPPDMRRRRGLPRLEGYGPRGILPRKRHPLRPLVRLPRAGDSLLRWGTGGGRGRRSCLLRCRRRRRRARPTRRLPAAPHGGSGRSRGGLRGWPGLSSAWRGVYIHDEPIGAGQRHPPLRASLHFAPDRNLDPASGLDRFDAPHRSPPFDPPHRLIEADSRNDDPKSPSNLNHGPFRRRT